MLDDVIKKVESSLNSADKSDKPNIFVQKLAELKKLPPSQQMAVSSLVGFGSGYTVGKFGQVVVITSLATGAVLYVSRSLQHLFFQYETKSSSFSSFAVCSSKFSMQIKRDTSTSIGAH